jgi:Skp family chaperone for outer membrane proteins
MKKHSRFDPRVIQSYIACDTDRLYGTLDQAIAYLNEVKAAHPNHTLQLSEAWDGYEDMHMEFTAFIRETQPEANLRAEEEIRQETERNELREKVAKQRDELATEETAHKRRVAAIINRGNI